MEPARGRAAAIRESCLAQLERYVGSELDIGTLIGTDGTGSGGIGSGGAGSAEGGKLGIHHSRNGRAVVPHYQMDFSLFSVNQTRA